MDAETLTAMAELAGRWGITSNTVSRRLAFLGIKPIRQGNFRYLTAEQLEQAEQLHQHVLSGRPMEAFPRPDQQETQVVRRVAAPVAAQVPQAEQLAALAAALRPAADPLQRARGLAEAADHGLVLTSSDLTRLLGQGVAAWRDGHLAYGYRFSRHKQGSQVLWTVDRALASNTSRATSPTLATSPATSRSVGFLADPGPVAAITIRAVSLPAF